MKTNFDKVQPRTLAGFMELLPDKQIAFNAMLKTIQGCYENFGFLPLDTPVIEASEVLLAKAGGETEKQIYQFNKGDTDLCLRFDLTVPLAKYVSQHIGELAFPFRRYQIGKVYRGERPQQGRFREFYQCDIDIIGDGELSIINDAEIPSIIYNTFQKLGFDNFTIKINNRKVLSGFFESLELENQIGDILRTIDKIDKVGIEAIKQELSNTYEISEEKINSIVSFVTIIGSTNECLEKLTSLNISNKTFNEGLNELSEVVKFIRIFGVPDSCFKIDLTIARGLDYYTGTVYETVLNDYPQIGSVCSGGRYDDLAQYYTDKKLPGVGISIGLTRLFYQLDKINFFDSADSYISKALVIPMDDNLEYSLIVTTAIRKSGINCETCTTDKKLKAKFSYANKLNIPFVIVIGEEESKAGTVSLKRMSNGEQYKVKIDEAIKIMTEKSFIRKVRNIEDYIKLYKCFENPPYSERWSLEQIQNEYNNTMKNGDVYGYFCNDKCVALIAFKNYVAQDNIIKYSEDKKVLMLSDIVVLYDERKKGIATELISYMIEYAKTNKYDILFFRTLEDETETINKISKKLGFVKNFDFYEVIHKDRSRNCPLEDGRVFYELVLS